MIKTSLPQIDIYTPTIKGKEIVKSANEDIDVDNFLHYPLLINNDGSLWKHGNLYLLSKLKTYNKPSFKTLNSIASDLKAFKQWCDNKNIDYLQAPRKRFRPTYLYRNYLNALVESNTISISTLKRRIGSIVNFYKYLITVENIKFKFPLWESGIASISYTDRHGFTNSKEVETTDVARVPLTSNSNLFDNSIEDGGKLHPLSKEQQISIIETLKLVENTEMTLGFLLSLTTGARIQTVYTLRRKHFEQIPTEDDNNVKIKVGYGTDCDTKFKKLHVLIVPKWVYNKMRIYLKSPRALKRLNKAKHIFHEENLQYAFLNKIGKPYYSATDDLYNKLYREPPNGNAIRVFINGTLKDELLKQDNDFHFSFHDLRASFGMNLLDNLMPLVENKEMTLNNALIRIKEHLGHESLTTTQQYLNFREQHKIKEQAQDEFEIYLMDILS